MEGLAQHHQSLALPSLMLVAVAAAEILYHSQVLVGLVERAVAVPEDRLLLLQRRGQTELQTQAAVVAAAV